MGKASPDVTTAGESGVRAAEKIHTEGLSCRGQRREKPRPVWETQEVRKNSRRAFGWGQFGRTDWVGGGVLAVEKEQMGTKRAGLKPNNCRVKGGRVRAKEQIL